MFKGITMLAPAKLNLALAVGPPRPSDGFHPICSWFVPISLADELEITPLAAEPSSYAIEWAADAPRPSPIDWPIEKDLAVRAHRALVLQGQRPIPVRMTLKKRIPVGGGLGGGSSDAAAMLHALQRLISPDNPHALRDQCAHIARTLGSDVSFFARDPIEPALVEGLGEQLTTVPPYSAQVLLIIPPFHTPTGPVYRAFDQQLPETPFEDRAKRVRDAAHATKPDPDEWFNDLAEPAERIQPELRHLRLEARTLLGRPVHLTGSGSTLFVLARSSEERAGFRDRLNSRLPGCALVDAEILPSSTPAA